MIKIIIMLDNDDNGNKTTALDHANKIMCEMRAPHCQYHEKIMGWLIFLLECWNGGRVPHLLGKCDDTMLLNPCMRRTKHTIILILRHTLEIYNAIVVGPSLQRDKFYS